MEQSKDSVRLVTSWYPAGTCTSTVALANAAWQELPELQVRDYKDFVAGYLTHVEGMPRYEVLSYVWDTLVGIAILTIEDDPHVGECASVTWQYVLPEYRNRGIPRQVLRQVQRLAVLANVPVYAYSHRTGPYTYSTRYRRVKCQKL